MRLHPAVIGTSARARPAAVAASGGGVLATELDGRGVARIAARRGQAVRVAELLRAQLGIEPPQGPRCAGRGDIGLAGIAPQTWLATREGAGNAFAQSLRSLLGECASVVDLSDAHFILRLTGPEVRAVLAKLVPIDLHPRSFEAGDVAQTVCGYVNVMLWRLEDAAQDEPSFEVWVGRSLAQSLLSAISHGAAEFGFVLQPSGAHPTAEGYAP